MVAPMADGSTVPGRRRLRRHAVSFAQWPLDAGITVVLFAGLGGACAGLEEANVVHALAAQGRAACRHA
jgi:hypothetical protein